MPTRIPQHSACPRRAFTLLELVLAILVMGVVSAVITPVIVSAADAYLAARTLRTASESSSFVADQIAKVLREAPPGTDTRLDATIAQSDQILFADGTGLRWEGDLLERLTPDGPALIATGVTAFEIQYIDEDGSSNASPEANAQRFHVLLELNGQPLTLAVFPRANTGGSGT